MSILTIQKFPVTFKILCKLTHLSLYVGHKNLLKKDNDRIIVLTINDI